MHYNPDSSVDLPGELQLQLQKKIEEIKLTISLLICV